MKERGSEGVKEEGRPWLAHCRAMGGLLAPPSFLHHKSQVRTSGQASLEVIYGRIYPVSSVGDRNKNKIK